MSKNNKPAFTEQSPSALEPFHPAARDWFESVFTAPTRPQSPGWPAIARNESTLILAPTSTGKTLAAFLWCITRLMFSPALAAAKRCRVLYISPIKKLSVDVERNLRAPLLGIAQAAQRLEAEFHQPTISIRTGDTPPRERAHFQRHPADIAGRSNIEEHLWVYGRRGEPCRRCGMAIESRKQGFDARTTFACPRYQPMELARTFRDVAAG